MDNPAAFPVAEVRIDGIGISEGSPGMTLRDYFAGQLLGACQLGNAPKNARELTIAQVEARGFANMAYIMADAMLAERAGVPA